MDVVGERGRVLDDDVGVPKAPAAPLSPVLVRRVPKCGEEPPYAVNRAREIRDPQLDVVECSPHHAADAKRPTSLPLWKVAPALTRATICAPLTSTRVTCIADENTAAVGQYFHETRESWSS